MESQLLSATQLAAELGVDRSTVHRRIDRGELVPAGYVDNRPLFRREDAEALARGEQTLPNEQAEEEACDGFHEVAPTVGTLWRFKSSKKTYKITDVLTAPSGRGTFVTLRALDTGANTTLSVDELRDRCVFLGRLS